MVCPNCHNENRYDALTCDFCMKSLPLSESRKEEIKRKKKIEKKNMFRTAFIKLIGTLLGILAVIAVIVIAWLNTRG